MSMRVIFEKCLVALMCLAFVAACSDDGGNNGGTGGKLTDAGADAKQATDADKTDDSGDNSSSDADQNHETDAGKDVEEQECGEGKAFCEGTCVDILASTKHCGGCGKSCQLFAECQQGSCICNDPNATYCDGYCIDTSVDRVNCGICGNTCGQGEICDDGSCKSKPDLVLEHTNTARSTPTDCGAEGQFNAAAPLQLDFELNKAAQAHAVDMATNEFVDHQGSDQSDLATRVGRTNYQGEAITQLIGTGAPKAEEMVNGMIGKDDTCSVMVSREATKLGVGFVAEDEEGTDGVSVYWVLVFGK